MILYDKLNNKISAGDVLKFDNGSLFLVFFYRDRFVIQNLNRYTPILKLECFSYNSVIPAIRINNISCFN